MSLVKFSTSNENISSNGGFSFISGILDSLLPMNRWDSDLPCYHNVQFSHQTIVRSVIAMMAAGCCNFADVEKLGCDSMFQQLVGEDIPSQESLRQRLNMLANRPWRPIVDASAAAILRKAELEKIKIAGLELIPIDIDVSVLEDTSSHKEGVAMSYHKVKGFAPIFCYAGKQGYMVANELRPGSQHSENGAVAFLERCVNILRAGGYAPKQLLLRVDSGHDSSDFIQKAKELGVYYIIKRNPRKENDQQLLDSIRSYEEPECPRIGKTIYRGFRSDKKPKGFESYNGYLAVEATVRTILADGQYVLGAGEIEVDSYWTNLPCTVKECVQLYHDHGTSEQFHSELKCDLGIELLPSGKMSTNALVLGLASIAFNCLRFIGDAALPVKEKEPVKEKKHEPVRMRLRTVLLFFIKFGCKLVRHANTIRLNVSRGFSYFATIKRIEASCCS